jgi:hypothetical protein
MKKIVLLLIFVTALFATVHSAKVIEALNSGGYTYIKVQEGSEQYWIAMTQRSVKKGETITYNEQGWMQQFHSKTLNRTFDKILFASDVTTPTTAVTKAMRPDVMNSKYKLQNTITIAELFAHRERYVGKQVRVRGVVTKTSSQIMKRNWVHIQDGSSFKGQDDVVFTTNNTMPAKESVVIAEGTVVIDKDFGYGYFYPVIVENAHFLVK